jgi:glycosyltransferase involved in cell wall biosynthesis
MRQHRLKMIRNKRVLIIAHLLHASPRIVGIAKYLSDYGWEPIIVTAPIPVMKHKFGAPAVQLMKNVQLIETELYANFVDESIQRASGTLKKRFSWILKGLRPILLKMLGIYRELAWYPDKEKKWIPLALKEARSVLTSMNIDAIVSSSSPVGTHIISNVLRQEFNIPWIADFRDLWSQNHAYPYSVIRKIFDRSLEKRTMGSADVLITVAEPLRQQLKELHRGKKTYVLTNGYDRKSFEKTNNQLTENFTITYTGQIYRQQDPQKIFLALRQLIDENCIIADKVKLRFFGPFSKIVDKLAKKHNLGAITEQNRVISPEDCIPKQQESHLLLLFNWEDEKAKGLYSQKIFDYLGAKRPILATGGFHNDDVRDQLLSETGAGYYCCTIDEIKKALLEHYDEYNQKNRKRYKGNKDEIEKYSYEHLTKSFANILNESI